jgi:cytoskeletal protein CcmA (bactofilin family)
VTGCPSEETWSLYVDGELPPEAARSLDAHLVGCRTCRVLLLALREEAELLGEALLERPRRSFVTRARPAPARGLAIGLGPAVAAVALVAGVAGWILERTPSSVEWLNPLRLTGASEMLFDLVFAFRDRAPDLFALAVSVAAVASVSAVLTFVLSLVVRRRVWPGALAIAALALIGAPSTSEAHFGLHEHEDFDLAAGDTHEGTLLVSGENVSIDGTVAGDLIAAADRVAVRGTIQGNAYVFANTLELSGTVEGSLHAFNNVAIVSGEIRSDLYAFADQLTLASVGRVGRNASVFVDKGVLEGSIGRDLFAAGGWSEVRGAIGGDLHAWRTRVELRESARIGGDVEAELKSEGDLKVSAGAVVGGETRTRLADSAPESSLARYTEPSFYVLLAVGFAAALVVGMLAHAVAPGLFAERLETAGEFFGVLGLGFLALVAAPVALMVAAVTVVGIPLALIGAGLYLIALYLSGIVVAALVGAAVLRSEPGDPSRFFLALVVGLVVVIVVAHLPFVTVPAHLVVILTGLGLLVRRARSWWAGRRAAGAAVAA